MAVDLTALAAIASTIAFKNLDALAYIIPLTLLVYYAVRWKLNARKLIYLLVRTTILLLLLVAVANPYLRAATDITVDATSVEVIADASESMRLYPGYDGMPERVYSRLKKTFENQSMAENIKLRYFSRGNTSKIGDAMLASVVDSSKENTIILLLSDGQNNAGRDTVSVASLAGESNATIFSVIAGALSEDVSVTDILGALKTPVRAPYDIGVVVEKTGDETVEYALEVTVDGRTVDSTTHSQSKKRRVHEFGMTFNEVGQHTISVSLTPLSADLFTQNNQMTKTVEVIDKANVLLVGRKRNTPLAQVLSTFYNVEETSSLRGNYANYAAVYLNDIEASALDANFDALRSFALDGGGIVFVGGNNSFEWGGYNNTLIETLLPVKSGSEPERKRKPITVVFLIDISSSTGYGKTGDTKLEVQKAIAAKIIGDLKDEDEVGVIAFNLLAYKVSDITDLASGRDYIIENILRLQPTGGSHFVAALKTAETMLEGVSNDKYVVILSDGLVPSSSLPLSREYAQLLADKGAKLYTIGVGFDTSESVLSKLAESGNGQYFSPEAYERIKIEFGSRGEPEGDENRVVVHNEYHFIARNLDLGYTTVEGYNVVTEKINSQVVLATEAGDPILTGWRFGLGRVAVLSTDDGGHWATQLYEGEGSKVFTALTNWVSADLEKGKPVNIEAEGAHLGDTYYITVKSAQEPVVSVQPQDGVIQQLPVRRRGIEHYEASYMPKKEGVYFVAAGNGLGDDKASFSVNYQREFKNVGTNLAALKAASESTGGGVYDESSLGELAAIISEINQKTSKRRVLAEKPLYLYFMTAALLLFFIDTCLRRVMEIYRLRKNK